MIVRIVDERYHARICEVDYIRFAGGTVTLHGPDKTRQCINLTDVVELAAMRLTPTTSCGLTAKQEQTQNGTHKDENRQSSPHRDRIA
jgi:hypothetical protein